MDGLLYGVEAGFPAPQGRCSSFPA